MQIKICGTCSHGNFNANYCEKRKCKTGWNDVCIMWKKEKERKGEFVRDAIVDYYGEKK